MSAHAHALTNYICYADVAKSFGAPVEPDSCALATLAARRALHLVAACMHVPAVHASMLEQSGLLQPPSTAQVVMVRTHPPVPCTEFLQFQWGHGTYLV